MSTDTEVLLAVGHQCSAEYCRLVDFLPFKCQHCELKFCGEHYTPTSHNCEKYDETKHNRIAPSCPLCNTPVAIPVGQDPNIRMEQHITSECSVMTGKSKTSSQPHCAGPRCKKVLYAPIRCDTCKQHFCPQHRFPKDHQCNAPTQTSTHKPAPMSKITSETSAKSAAAMSAIKRSLATKTSTFTAPVKTTNYSTPQTASSSSSATNSSSAKHNNPFSKTDRRARAERESRLKAMEERAKKGLLSEDEKAILAAEKAKAQDGDQCIVM